MTITPTPTWTRSMERAMREEVKPTRCVDGTYRVPSVSHPGTFHTVLLDDAGHIIHCDCLGFAHGGRQRPCKHAGAVALAISFLGGHSFVIEREMDTVATTKRQLFRAEA
jgi:SWIM zinc finger